MALQVRPRCHILEHARFELAPRLLVAFGCDRPCGEIAVQLAQLVPVDRGVDTAARHRAGAFAPEQRRQDEEQRPDDEKRSQLQRLADFQARHAHAAPAMLHRLQQAVIEDENVFAVLMEAVRVCSLGQISNALFEVGGQYRRNM